VRLLRFSLLLVVVLAVYFAQYIFDHRSLSNFFPRWFLDAFPTFYRFTRWLPADLLNLAWWIAGLGSTGFGLLVPQWRGEDRWRLPMVIAKPRAATFLRWSGWICVAMAILLAAYTIPVVRQQFQSGVGLSQQDIWVAYC
jgi:hypothetical protein